MTDSKEKLFDATIELVEELGIAGASTAKIAQRANTATGTLFHHFPKKEDLFAYVYIEIQKRKMKSLVCADDCTDEINEESTKMFVTKIINYWVNHKKEFEFTRQMVHSKLYTAALQEEVETLHSNLHQDIMRDMEEGNLRTCDTKVLMESFHSLILSIVNLVLHATNEEERKKYLDEGYQFIWHAIKP